MAKSNSQRAMPWLLMIVAIALLAGRIGAQFLAPDATPNSLVHWIPLDDLGQIAASSQKPILLDFTAEWCAPCHLLDAEVFRDPAMANDINSRFIAARVLDRKTEEGRNSPIVSSLEARYGVNGFPTVIVVDRTGNELARMEGYRGREQFQRVMESVR